jgi:hypothetical protein
MKRPHLSHQVMALYQTWHFFEKTIQINNECEDDNQNKDRKNHVLLMQGKGKQIPGHKEVQAAFSKLEMVLRCNLCKPDRLDPSL